jgi:hypothetical protein
LDDPFRVHPHQDVDRLTRIGEDLYNIGTEKVEPENFVAVYMFVDGINGLRITPEFLSILERDAAIARQTAEVAALESQLHTLNFSARRTGKQQMDSECSE